MRLQQYVLIIQFLYWCNCLVTGFVHTHDNSHSNAHYSTYGSTVYHTISKTVKNGEEDRSKRITIPTKNSVLTLFAARNIPGSRPPPRRNLKKRKNRRNRRNQLEEIQEESIPEESIEIRPLVNFKSIEAGMDYWMDERDLAKSLDYERALKNRKMTETEIPKEKLREEVVAPYKQNWIGLLCVSIITLAVIIKEFPDLLDSPTIPIPDL